MHRSSRLALMLVAVAGTAASSARAQLIGSGPGTNTFPFGGANSGPPSTVYQQIYASSDFTGPELISAIEFFRASVGGDLRAATYDFYLSTTTVAVNGLSVTNFDSNRGANNTLFGSFVLSGAAPSTLVFAGTPFAYDPSGGNLLLDIRISGGSPSTNASTFRANRGDAGGVYSRATDFVPTTATSFVDWGLITQFDATPITATPEPATLGLVALGLGSLFAIRRHSRRAGTSPTLDGC